jgi:hypothetical protein
VSPPQEADGELRFLVIANDRDNEQHLVWCAARAACLRVLRLAGRVHARCACRRCPCAAPDAALCATRSGERRPNPALLALVCRLVDLKNIYAKQLPNMPKDYIVRLVFDRGHKSLIAVKACVHAGCSQLPRGAC